MDSIGVMTLTAEERDLRAELILFGFIRISQKELLKANVTSNNGGLFNNIPNGIYKVCMIYYYDIRIMFDEAFQLFITSSSLTKLDGNKYFLDIFLKCAKSTNENRHHMIDKELISILGHFYLGMGKNKSPYTDEKWKYHAMDPQPNTSTVIQVITTLLCACHTPQTTRLRAWFNENKSKYNLTKHQQQLWMQLSSTALSYKSSEEDEYLLHQLSKKDEMLPHCRVFYRDMIDAAHNNNDILHSLNNLLIHWSYEDKSFSGEIANIIVKGFDTSTPDGVPTFLAIMHKFIMIEDTIQQYRLQQLHLPNSTKYIPSYNGIFHLIKAHVRYKKFTYKCIKGLIFMILDYEIYANYMINKRDEWMWWDLWLNKYCIQKEKLTFYTETYIPLLLKHGIECHLLSFV